MTAAARSTSRSAASWSRRRKTMLDWLIRGAQVLDGTGADAFSRRRWHQGRNHCRGRSSDRRRCRARSLTRARPHADARLSGHPPPHRRGAVPPQFWTCRAGAGSDHARRRQLRDVARAARGARSRRAPYLAPITGAFGDELCFASLCGLFCRSGANAANREQRHARGHGDAPRPRRGL